MVEPNLTDDSRRSLGVAAGSPNRQVVLRSLSEEGTGTPKQIATDTDLTTTAASRALTTLVECGAVELLVPDDTRKGRVYRITDAGKTALELLPDRDGEDSDE